MVTPRSACMSPKNRQYITDINLDLATRQIYFASIRSFFEIHYSPLAMRKGDYPTGDSSGVKRATKEAILRVLNNKHQRMKENQAI